jgi:light-regulated signal transduction histidine kinase (bacteriophytochrome)
MQLIYAASHDLQEPLRTQLNYLDLLSEEMHTAKHDEWLHFVGRASHAVNRMQTLIADLLDYASLGMQTKREPIDLQSLLAEIQEDLSQAVDKKHAVIRVGKLPWFKGNRSELKQLFQNLLTNAIKYVSIDTIPNIEISVKREGRFVVFSIVDNGIGIAEEHFQKIFLMFQRLHRREQYDGTGIGLALCKKIVENYDGQIGLCSTVGKGSSFWMKFHEISILGDFE